ALQQWPEGANRQDLAEEFQLQLLAPLDVGCVGKSRDAALPRVIDEQVESASGPLAHFCSECIHASRIENVAAFSQARTRCFVIELCLGCGEAVAIATAYCHPRTICNQELGRGEADAGAPSCDHSDATRQTEIHGPSLTLPRARPVCGRAQRK